MIKMIDDVYLFDLFNFTNIVLAVFAKLDYDFIDEDKDN